MLRKVLGLAAMFGVVVLPSFGATITNGVFDFSGSIYVTTFEATPVVTPAGTCPVGQACIFWSDSAGNNPSGYPGVLGGKVDISTAGLPNGDIPTAISGNDAANISTILNPPEAVGGSGFAPQLFMSFENDAMTTTLSINYIAPGVFGAAGCASAPPAPGQVCSPAGSPFNFINAAGGSSSATYLFSGITNAGGDWTASFASPFAESYQEVLAGVAANGYFQDTFAAQLTLTTPSTAPPMPEPSEFAMMAIGIGLLGLATRRRRSVRCL
jgi:hypothetical protein